MQAHSDAQTEKLSAALLSVQRLQGEADGLRAESEAAQNAAAKLKATADDRERHLQAVAGMQAMLQDQNMALIKELGSLRNMLATQQQQQQQQQQRVAAAVPYAAADENDVGVGHVDEQYVQQRAFGAAAAGRANVPAAAAGTTIGMKAMSRHERAERIERQRRLLGVSPADEATSEECTQQ